MGLTTGPSESWLHSRLPKTKGHRVTELQGWKAALLPSVLPTGGPTRFDERPLSRMHERP